MALGTRNPAKVEGVRLVFSGFFPDVEVKTLDGSKATVAQPIGFGQITEGAVSRARLALSELGGDFGVGVEAGIFEMGGSYFDHQQAAIVDGSGRVSTGHSAGYPLPRSAMEKMVREGRELEEFAVEISGVEEIGDKGGLINHLTKGRMTRTDLTEQCVLMALVPWLHADTYGF